MFELHWFVLPDIEPELPLNTSILCNNRSFCETILYIKKCILVTRNVNVRLLMTKTCVFAFFTDSLYVKSGRNCLQQKQNKLWMMGFAFGVLFFSMLALLLNVTCVLTTSCDLENKIFIFRKSVFHCNILKCNLFLWIYCNLFNFQHSSRPSVSHDHSENILICWFAAQDTYPCWKQLCCLIFLWKPWNNFHGFLMNIKIKRTAFIWNIIFYNCVKFFTLTLDQLNASLL